MVPLVNPAASRQPLQLQVSRPWMASGVRWAVVVLAVIATSAAGYLAWEGLNHRGVAGCDGTGVISCDEVLQSRWSQWFGIPVGVFGLLVYAAILIDSLLTMLRDPTKSRWIATALAMFSLVAAASGIWFFSLQVFAVGKLCVWCIGVHLCGLLIACLVWWSALRQPKGRINASQSFGALSAAMSTSGARRTVAAPVAAGPSLPIAAGGAVLLMAILIGGQAAYAPASFKVTKVALAAPIDFSSPSTSAKSSDTSPHVDSAVTPAESTETDIEPLAADGAKDQSSDSTAAKSSESKPPKLGSATKPAPVEIPKPSSQRMVKFLGGKLSIDTYSEAIVGSPDAPYVIVEMVDYTCPHCRKMAKNMLLAEERYGDQLAIVVLPVPLELECNKKLPKTDPMHKGSCKLARLAISVAAISQTAFRDFHDFLFAKEDNVPTVSKALVRAYALVDRQMLSGLQNSDAIKERIQKYIDFYAALSAQQSTPDKPFGLPAIIVGDSILSGDIEDPQQMYDVFEKELGIKPL